MDTSPRWYLLKHDDGATFGPVTIAQIKEWALSAQISPFDKISGDGTNWQKAPTVPELAMDWLVMVGPDQYYGPTTLESLVEFLRAGEIDRTSLLINCCEGTEQKVGDVPALNIDPTPGTFPAGPGRTGIRQNLQQRIRDLERALLEERRRGEILEERFKKLEAK